MQLRQATETYKQQIDKHQLLQEKHNEAMLRHQQIVAEEKHKVNKQKESWQTNRMQSPNFEKRPRQNFAKSSSKSTPTYNRHKN